jgi:hypothetical protein
MAKSVPSGIVVMYDNSGGTPVNITQYVLAINGVDVEQIIEETHSFGDSWEESLPVGIGKMAPIELSGIYDDTATTGPDALFVGQVPATPATSNYQRTLTLTWVGAKTTAVETVLVKYTRSPDRNGLTKYSATLQPTGVVTEA